MSDSGFVDEAPSGGERPPRAASRSSSSSTVRPATAGEGGTASGGAPGKPPPVGEHRPGAVAAVPTGLALLAAALLGFAGWAWAGRVHADDVAAYEALAQQIEQMDRSLPPLGHGAIPPCRDSDAGRVTRTYPPTTGPQAAELVGYLQQQGWAPSPAAPPIYAHLSRSQGGHVLTLDVVAPTAGALVESITALSPASAFGCVGR